jgi:hypothetical protein
MKKILLTLALVLSLGSAFAQSLTNTTLSPFATATRLLQTASVTLIAGPLASTMTTVQSRGVAGKEQMKDDLMLLNDDMVSGAVKSIKEVRQPALKELFLEIEADKKQMAQINSTISEGSKLHKVSSAVIIVLLAE